MSVRIDETTKPTIEGLRKKLVAIKITCELFVMMLLCVRQLEQIKNRLRRKAKEPLSLEAASFSSLLQDPAHMPLSET
jgi:hypothetical protein